MNYIDHKLVELKCLPTTAPKMMAYPSPLLIKIFKQGTMNNKQKVIYFYNEIRFIIAININNFISNF